MTFYRNDFEKGVTRDDFTFGNSNVELVIGGRHCGKTSVCAAAAVDYLAKGKSVLAVLPTNEMNEVFQRYCHEVAEERGFKEFKYFKLDTYNLAEVPWGSAPRGTYDLIIFVDGPDNRNPVFNGQHHAFNLDPSFHAMLVMHRDHVALNGWDSILERVKLVKPKFIVSCNLFNLYREDAQKFFNWVTHGNTTPMLLVERAKELDDDKEIVRSLVYELLEKARKARFISVGIRVGNSTYRAERMTPGRKEIQLNITTRRDVNDKKD